MPGPLRPAPAPVPRYEDAARLTVSAACELMVPRVSSATVVGTGPAVAAHLGALVRRMACLGNITVYPGPADGPPRWPSARTAALAAGQGITLLGAESLDRALLGADLVVLTDGVPASVGSSARRRALLAPDAVVIHTAAPAARPQAAGDRTARAAAYPGGAGRSLRVQPGRTAGEGAEPT